MLGWFIISNVWSFSETATKQLTSPWDHPQFHHIIELKLILTPKSSLRRKIYPRIEMTRPRESLSHKIRIHLVNMYMFGKSRIFQMMQWHCQPRLRWNIKRFRHEFIVIMIQTPKNGISLRRGFFNAKKANCHLFIMKMSRYSHISTD